MNEYLGLVSVIVEDYDQAIEFFVNKLGFVLREDSPAVSTTSGQPKRWVVVGPQDAAQTGFVLAQASNEDEKRMIGKQWSDRVGLFLYTNDFDKQYTKMKALGVEFLGSPTNETFGRYVVFRDVAGNKWDLIKPKSKT